MKAKHFLLVSAMLLLLAGCSRKEGEEVIELSYANFPPPETFPCVQMERWKEEVERRTNGRVRIKTYPGGTLLGAKAIYDGVADGTAAIGNFAMSYQPGRFPVSEATDLPHFSPAVSLSPKRRICRISSRTPRPPAIVSRLFSSRKILRNSLKQRFLPLSPALPASS